MRTRDAIRAGLTDEAALICTLLGEAASEPLEGQVAVACAIRNRVRTDLGNDGKDDWWGEGYRAVCLKLKQFSCWWETHPNTDRVYALAEKFLDEFAGGAADAAAAIYTMEDLSPELEAVVQQLHWVAVGVMSGALQDRAKGADHYLTTALLHSPAAPPWAKTKPAVAVVGAHTFFRLG